jgi:hypothetical protein
VALTKQTIITGVLRDKSVSIDAQEKSKLNIILLLRAGYVPACPFYQYTRKTNASEQIYSQE